MLFNWYKKKSRGPGDEWPQFTDSLVDPEISPAQAQSMPRQAFNDARFCPKAEEEIVAAARLVY